MDEDDWGESGPTLGEDLAKLKDEISNLAALCNNCHAIKTSSNNL